MEKAPREITFAPIPEETERLGKLVLDAAYRVHTALGPGLLESAYETTLAHEIRKNGVAVATQVALPIQYDGLELELGYRLDLLIEKAVIVELKATENMIPLYEAQLMTYLRLSGVRLGYLINFNVRHLKHGIKRIVV
ncbi:MAG: GxxExxY protein [Anaerolineales bacterium]